jgi:hypothetical protein
VKVFCCTLIHCFSTVNIFHETFRAEWQLVGEGGLEVTAIRVEKRTIRLGFRFGLEIRWSTKGGNVGWGAVFRTSELKSHPSNAFFIF